MPFQGGSAISAELATVLGLNQGELLDILAARFGHKLLAQIKRETRYMPEGVVLRKWVKHQTHCPLRIIADECRSARRRAGLTQQELANAIGCPRTQITRLEICRSCATHLVKSVAGHLQDERLNGFLMLMGWV